MANTAGEVKDTRSFSRASPEAVVRGRDPQPPARLFPSLQPSVAHFLQESLNLCHKARSISRSQFEK
jgi:hypothetical protein